MDKYEKVSISDYLALIHHDDREKISRGIQQKVINGELVTEEDFNREFHQDLRYNKTPPKIGQLSPIIRFKEGESEKIGDTEIPHIIMSIVEVMITE